MLTSSPAVKRRGLAFKLSLLILSGTAVTFITAFSYNYFYSYNRILKDVEANAQNLTFAAVGRIETILRGIEKDPSYFAHALSEGKIDREALLRRIESLLNTNPDIYGSAVAFEPYAMDPKSLYFAPYYCRDGRSLKLIYLGGKAYQYFYREWYQITKELERAVWSEPCFDEGAGNIVMSTYSVPFSRKRDGTPEELIKAVLQSVRDFAGSEPQSDDITMLALTYNGAARKR